MITNFGAITTYYGAGFPSVNALIYDIALALTNGDNGDIKSPTTGDKAPSGQQWMWQVNTPDAALFVKTAAYDPLVGPLEATPITWVFEASQLIDPFSQITPLGEIIPFTDATPGATYGTDTIGTDIIETLATAYPVNPAKDPWRICFQTFAWKNYPTYQKAAPPAEADGKWNSDLSAPKPSLAVYIGTPATLNANDPTKLKIGYRQSWPNQVPSWIAAGIADGSTYVNYTTINTAGSMPSSYLARRSYDFIEPQGNTGARWTHNFDPSVASTGLIKFGSPPDTVTINNITNSTGENLGGQAFDGPDISETGQTFVNRYFVKSEKTGLFGTSTGTASDGAPMSYQLTLSDHGMFLAVWAQNPEEEASDYSWVLVQRPVDKKTGIVRGVYDTLEASSVGGQPGTNSGRYGDPGNAGNRPLFCVNSTSNDFYKFVVREHDLPIPSIPKDAANNSEDSGAVLNAYSQLSITENGEYVITFINNLNSSRFKYADELDMVGTVSADIVGGGTDIAVAVYNEVEPVNFQPAKRTYHALWPSGKFGTKMRVVVVKSVTNPQFSTRTPVV